MKVVVMINIAVFASHNGSNLQAVINGCKEGKISGRVALVISNNPDAFALQRAKNAAIPAFCLNKKSMGEKLDEATFKLLAEHRADLIFLAGYLKKLPPCILHGYKDRIYNIHPALLPKFGGKGMFGMNVHKAVIAAGEDFSGATIHRVSGEYDTGEIVSQATVPVMKDDTPETLAKRVLEAEHELIVRSLAEIVKTI